MFDDKIIRRLAAIAVADFSGCGRLILIGEFGTVTRLEAFRGAAIDPSVAAPASE